MARINATGCPQGSYIGPCWVACLFPHLNPPLTSAFNFIRGGKIAHVQCKRKLQPAVQVSQGPTLGHIGKSMHIGHAAAV